MNTKDNKRRKESKNKIENAFVELLLLYGKEVNEISVTEICKLANVNRSTFYANYLDIFDLIDKIGERMINDFYALYEEEETKQYNSHDFLKLFCHIRENQLFYKTYFKLGLDSHFNAFRYDVKLAKYYYDNKHIEYHIDYFKAGITAIIKKWLNNNCDLEPEELFQIIKDEYQNKHPF